MTTSIEVELDSRRRQKPRRESYTFALDLNESLLAELIFATRVRFPSPLYRNDPVGFVRTILGAEPWNKQIEILEAVRDYRRVAVRSGHKIGKSTSAAMIALWFYCSFDDARVVMTSTTARQVDQILWREVRMLKARGGRCLACKLEDPEGNRIIRPCSHSSLIEGDEGMLARTGLKAPDFREIVGFTAREAEAVAGISGRNLLYLVDEASGVLDEIFEAIEGNRAGGARLVLFSNPTRNDGEFFEAFESKSHLYHCLTISSEETPNVLNDNESIPGLATRAWVDEKKLEWGEDSPLYLIRVKGVHATREDGKIFSVDTIERAEQRWYETEATGRLYIGVDPAGDTGTGDETAIITRRGLKMLSLDTHRGLNEQQHLVRILEVIQAHRVPRETPVVVIDREGSIGSKLYLLLRNYLDDDKRKDLFELVALRASDKAHRRPDLYDRLRDELVANLELWFRDGGAILEDVKLEKELHQFEWTQIPNGKLKTTPKSEIKKAIGRSPDRFDGLALSCWEPLSLKGDDGPGGDVPPAAAKVIESAHDVESVLDPYSAEDTWK